MQVMLGCYLAGSALWLCNAPLSFVSCSHPEDIQSPIVSNKFNLFEEIVRIWRCVEKLEYWPTTEYPGVSASFHPAFFFGVRCWTSETFDRRGIRGMTHGEKRALLVLELKLQPKRLFRFPSRPVFR